MVSLTAMCGTQPEGRSDWKIPATANPSRFATAYWPVITVESGISRYSQPNSVP